MNRIEAFFSDLDRAWPDQPAQRIELSLIGCGALMLQADYERGTKDSDIFETLSLTKEIQAHLIALAGRDAAVWHPTAPLNAQLKHLELRVLDIVDVVVSKLKRFSPNDKADIDAMVQRGLVSHQRLVDRFRSAYNEFSYDARAADLGGYVEHLNQVERDMLGEPETEFDLSLLRY